MAPRRTRALAVSGRLFDPRVFLWVLLFVVFFRLRRPIIKQARLDLRLSWPRRPSEIEKTRRRRVGKGPFLSLDSKRRTFRMLRRSGEPRRCPRRKSRDQMETGDGFCSSIATLLNYPLQTIYLRRPYGISCPDQRRHGDV